MSKEYTEEDYLKMMEALRVRDEKLAEERRVAEVQHLKIIRELVNSDAFKEILEALPVALDAYRDDERFRPFLDCLHNGMRPLTGMVGQAVMINAPPSTPTE